MRQASVSQRLETRKKACRLDTALACVWNDWHAGLHHYEATVHGISFPCLQRDGQGCWLVRGTNSLPQKSVLLFRCRDVHLSVQADGEQLQWRRNEQFRLTVTRCACWFGFKSFMYHQEQNSAHRIGQKREVPLVLLLTIMSTDIIAHRFDRAIHAGTFASMAVLGDVYRYYSRHSDSRRQPSLHPKTEPCLSAAITASQTRVVATESRGRKQSARYCYRARS